MKAVILISILLVFSIIFLLLSRSKVKAPFIKAPFIKLSKEIKLKELEAVLGQLVEEQLEYNYFGITSNGTDCLYFSNEDGKINIEFEVMTLDQQPLASQLTQYAKTKGFEVLEISYGNKPKYDGLEEAPVYKLELNADRQFATEIGIEIMRLIFKNNGTTTYEVVP